MNSSKFRFTLDLHSVQSQYSIPAMVGDTGITLYINLTDGGVPYVINDGCLAKISIKRPTGTYIEEFCAIRNNATVEYPFRQNENTCAVEGIHDCDVTLYGPDGAKVGGPRFTMVVSERVVNSDDINITDENRTAIDAIIAEEASRRIAEDGRVQAEIERAANEETRKFNEEARQTNEEERKAIFDKGVDVFEKAIARLDSATSKVTNVVLPAGAWDGTESPYYQVVTIEGVTEHSKVDLQPSVEQLDTFQDEDLAFVAVNEGGVITVYAIGDKPTNDYIIQATITEVII